MIKHDVFQLIKRLRSPGLEKKNIEKEFKKAQSIIFMFLNTTQHKTVNL